MLRLEVKGGIKLGMLGFLGGEDAGYGGKMRIDCTNGTVGYCSVVSRLSILPSFGTLRLELDLKSLPGSNRTVPGVYKSTR